MKTKVLICRNCEKSITIPKTTNNKIYCDECIKRKKAERNKNWRLKNPERAREQSKKWLINNPEKAQKIREKHKKYAKERHRKIMADPEKRKELNLKRRIWKANHPDKVREDKIKWRREHREERLLCGKRWRERNKEKTKDYRHANRDKLNKRKQERRKADIQYKLRDMLGRRIYKMAKAQSICSLERGRDSRKLLGCDVKTLKAHLESQFVDGMSWENYGNDGWHIDHIIPCASFDLSKVEEQRICFNYRNLQPLWSKDNMSKSDKLPENHQEIRMMIQENIVVGG
jgi:hypothetical protein